MKKKNHIRVNGQLLKTDKKFTDLSLKQREFINQLLFDEYSKSWLQNNREPGKSRMKRFYLLQWIKLGVEAFGYLKEKYTSIFAVKKHVFGTECKS